MRRKKLIDGHEENDRTCCDSKCHIRHRSLRGSCTLVDTLNQPHCVQLENAAHTFHTFQALQIQELDSTGGLTLGLFTLPSAGINYRGAADNFTKNNNECLPD